MTVLTIDLDSADHHVRGAPVIVVASPYPSGRPAELVSRVGEPRELDLRPGRYGIRADLPSGASLTESVLLGDRPAEVRFEVGDALTFFTDSAQRRWGEFPDDAWIRLWQRTGPQWRVTPWPGPPTTRLPDRATYPLPAAGHPRMVQTGSRGLRPQLTVLPAATDLEITVRPAAGPDPWLAVFVLTGDPVAEAIHGHRVHGGLERATMRDVRPIVDDAVLGSEDQPPGRRALLDAVRAGLPVRPRSLRLLVDGLQRLAEVEAEAALAVLDPYLAAADFTQTTVTFTGNGPDRPDPRATNAIDAALPYAESLPPFDLDLTEEVRAVTLDVPAWRLSSSRWSSVSRLLAALDGDLRDRDRDRVRYGVAELELAAPARGVASDTTPPPQEVLDALSRVATMVAAIAVRR